MSEENNVMFCTVATGRMNDGDEGGDMRREERTRRSGKCGKRILLIVVNTATFKTPAGSGPLIPPT